VSALWTHVSALWTQVSALWTQVSALWTQVSALRLGPPVAAPYNSPVGRESQAHPAFCLWDDTLTGLDLTTYPEKVNLISYQVGIKKSAGPVLKSPPPQPDFVKQIITAPSALPVIIEAFGMHVAIHFDNENLTFTTTSANGNKI